MKSGKFKHGPHEVTMHLGYKLAQGKLSDLGLDVLSIMHEQNIIMVIMFDDSVMLKVWYYYIQEGIKNGELAEQTWEEALDILDQTKDGLEPFKKAFWEMTVTFFPIPLQSTLRRLWREAEKKIKDALDSSLNSSISPQQESSE